MDCRKGLWLALGLWGGAAGCQHTATGVAGNAPAPAVTAPADVVVTRKPANGPKKMPKPEMCVAYGDYRAVEASSSNYSPSQRERMRDDARTAYQDALKVDPKCLGAQQGLARLSVAGEDYPRAVAMYKKALQTAPKNASLWFELGMCHNRMQQWDAALGAMTRAAALEPENRTYVNAQAVILARLGRHQESLECFGRVNGEAQAHFNLACTLRRLNLQDLSRQHLEIALQSNPKLDSARAMLTEMAGPPARQALAAPSPIRSVSYVETQSVEPTRGPEAEADSAPPAPADEAIAGPPEMDLNSPFDPPEGSRPNRE